MTTYSGLTSSGMYVFRDVLGKDLFMKLPAGCRLQPGKQVEKEGPFKGLEKITYNCRGGLIYVYKIESTEDLRS